MPGVLPVINRKAVENVIMAGLALNCSIALTTKFDRKSYPYPDLMKGYQITQYDAPIASGGWIDIDMSGYSKRIGITRIHLEEDVAKLIHRVQLGGDSYSLMDVNRSGVALMEIVGEPDLRSPEEARNYLVKLRSIIQYLGVSSGNMEEGSFRCDANVSIRPIGSKEFLTRVEIKNMNSFRSVYLALVYEAKRQIALVEGGGRVEQETRGWDQENWRTVSQRTKELAHDYRYFPEPDLPPLVIDGKWVEDLRVRLPELPEMKRDRFIKQYGVSLNEANLLTFSKSSSEFFETTMSLGALEGDAIYKRARGVGNWMLGELTRLLRGSNQEINECKVKPSHLWELLGLLDEGVVTTTLAKVVLEEVFCTGKAPAQIVGDNDYVQLDDPEQLGGFVEDALMRNPQAVADYINGKDTAAGFLMGHVMKASKGKANPNKVNEALRRRLQQIRAS
jgi:aspartyl-tRNA(Asn)/glutamyl-tRNA(Gln) amidotransferase subunit B